MYEIVDFIKVGQESGAFVKCHHTVAPKEESHDALGTNFFVGPEKLECVMYGTICLANLVHFEAYFTTTCLVRYSYHPVHGLHKHSSPVMSCISRYYHHKSPFTIRGRK